MLSDDKKELIEQVLDSANRLGLNIYLVGGTLRDILLKRQFFDIDLVLEGNALNFARYLQGKLGGQIKTYGNFLSATIILSDFSLDLVTARKERYKYYGALPEILPGNIYDDLKRRDFTINAIALDLKNNKIIDPFGGQSDLENKVLRILHKDSFKEDPTRILRAARYQGRLGFSLSKTSEEELMEAKIFLNNVSPSRLKNEYIKIITDEAGLKTLHILESWGVMPYFLPGIVVKKAGQKCLDAIKTHANAHKKAKETWLITLMALYWQCASVLKDILEVKFDFSNKERFCLEWLVKNQYLLRKLINEELEISLFHLHHLLYNTPQEIETFLLWLLGEKGEYFLQDIKTAREGIKLPLTGKDLLQLGISPGPLLGEILKEMEKQVLLGKIGSRKEALNWLKKVWNNNDKFYN